MIGTVCKLMTEKGYGFIQEPNEREMRFFHVKAVVPQGDFLRFQVGSKVEFEPDDSGPTEKSNGKRAVSVRLCSR